MSKVLICITDASDAHNVRTHIVSSNSRAAELARKFNESLQFIDDDEIPELLDLLDNEDTYHLPCTIDAVYIIGVIY